MVDILLMQTVSIAIASAGVFLAAIYYVLQLRHQTSAKQVDLIMRIRSMWLDKEMVQSWETIRKTEFKNYDDYKEKCPGEARQVAGFFDNLGLLLHRGLIDIGLVSELFLLEVPWQKMKLFVEGGRERANEPRIYCNFEYLYNEVKKREQQLQQKGAKNG